MIEYVTLGKVLAPFASKATAALLHRAFTGKKTAWGVAAEVSEAITEFSVEKARVRAVVQRRELIEAFCDENAERGPSVQGRTASARRLAQPRCG